MVNVISCFTLDECVNYRVLGSRVVYVWKIVDNCMDLTSYDSQFDLSHAT